METITHNGHTFTVVEEVSLGYKIWNIGKNMLDGYLPLCRLAAQQPFPGGRKIETDTLKAIKTEGAQDILAVATRGTDTIAKMERYLAKHKGAKPGSSAFVHSERIRKALPWMREIKWLR